MELSDLNIFVWACFFLSDQLDSDIQRYSKLKMLIVPYAINVRGIASTPLWNRLFACKKEHTNSVDPDETPQNAASHQGLCCLPR